jgi:putative ABC transport system substrate-binding protein
MNRRTFLCGLTVGTMSTAFDAEAQEAREKSRTVALLWPLIDGSVIMGVNPNADAFRQGLAELGYVAGRNVSIDVTSAEGRDEALPRLAAELVRRRPDVIVTVGEFPVRTLMSVTTTIPIVVLSVGDPVGTGLVKSLTRPGGNVTALSHIAPELSAKRVELLKEIAPGISRLTMLWNPTNPHNALQLRDAQAGARSLGIDLQSIEIRNADDIEPAFATMARKRTEGFTVAADNVLYNLGKRIVERAKTHRLYAVYPDRYAGPGIGGLMSYGPVFAELWRQAGVYAGKILSGVTPADLPVQQPTKFELVINLKTAKALGLTIPQSLLLRADQLIE